MSLTIKREAPAAYPSHARSAEQLALEFQYYLEEKRRLEEEARKAKERAEAEIERRKRSQIEEAHRKLRWQVARSRQEATQELGQQLQASYQESINRIEQAAKEAKRQVIAPLLSRKIQFLRAETGAYYTPIPEKTRQAYRQIEQWRRKQIEATEMQIRHHAITGGRIIFSQAKATIRTATPIIERQIEEWAKIQKEQVKLEIEAEKQKQLRQFMEKTMPTVIRPKIIKFLKEKEEYERSVEFWTKLGYPEYAGKYAPIKIPEGMEIESIRETKHGLEIKFKQPKTWTEQWIELAEANVPKPIREVLPFVSPIYSSLYPWASAFPELKKLPWHLQYGVIASFESLAKGVPHLAVQLWPFASEEWKKGAHKWIGPMPSSFSGAVVSSAIGAVTGKGVAEPWRELLEWERKYPGYTAGTILGDILASLLISKGIEKLWVRIRGVEAVKIKAVEEFENLMAQEKILRAYTTSRIITEKVRIPYRYYTWLDEFMEHFTPEEIVLAGRETSFLLKTPISYRRLVELSRPAQPYISAIEKTGAIFKQAVFSPRNFAVAERIIYTGPQKLSLWQKLMIKLGKRQAQAQLIEQYVKFESSFPVFGEGGKVTSRHFTRALIKGTIEKQYLEQLFEKATKIELPGFGISQIMGGISPKAKLAPSTFTVFSDIVAFESPKFAPKLLGFTAFSSTKLPSFTSQPITPKKLRAPSIPKPEIKIGLIYALKKETKIEIQPITLKTPKFTPKIKTPIFKLKTSQLQFELPKLETKSKAEAKAQVKIKIGQKSALKQQFEREEIIFKTGHSAKLKLPSFKSKKARLPSWLKGKWWLIKHKVAKPEKLLEELI